MLSAFTENEALKAEVKALKAENKTLKAELKTVNSECAKFKFLVENSFRALALGRKNYLFAGSHEGAERIAMMYSFFASCKAQGVNPYEWLKHTLDVIGDYPQDRLVELLPGYQNKDGVG